MTEPCKVCSVPGVPRHTRQRVITRADGSRWRVCERCGEIIGPALPRSLTGLGVDEPIERS